MIRGLLDLLLSMGSYVGALIIIVVLLASALRIIPEYQRGWSSGSEGTLAPRGPGS